MVVGALYHSTVAMYQSPLSLIDLSLTFFKELLPAWRLLASVIHWIFAQ